MAQQDRERGERIAELRKAAGYTSAQKLAVALDVNYRSVQNWEAGKGIYEENVKALSDLLNVPREFILYGESETPDVIGMVNGRQDTQAQLDRIEANQEQILGELKAVRLALAAPSRQPVSTPRAPRSRKGATGS